jgi:5-methylcytosine-specific restriction endonuclease McrA
MYKCKTCGIEKPHTKKFFYLYGMSKVTGEPYIRYICIDCDKETSYKNRKVRQAIARVDRLERKFVRTISNQVIKQIIKEQKRITYLEDKASTKAQKSTARLIAVELEKEIKKAHKEALKENVRRDHEQMWAQRKAATKQRQKDKRTTPEYREAQRKKRKTKLANETLEQRTERLMKQKVYRDANRDYYRQKSTEWNKKNPERAVRAVIRRRAQKLSNGYEIYTTQQVLDLYGTSCHICGLEIDISTSRKIGSQGWKKSLQVDHVIPISKGGPDTLENVRPSHAVCNMEKRDKLPEQVAIPI